jgi:PAS domain S-box-containing protein
MALIESTSPSVTRADRAQLAVLGGSVVLAVAIGALIWGVDRPAVTTLLVVVPLLAAIRVGALATAVVAVVAVVVAFVAGLVVDVPSWTNHGVRVGIVSVGGLIAVWIASLRTRLETEGTRLAYLAEMGTLLGGTLELRTAMRELSRLAVPVVADWCIVDLVREDGKGTEQIAVAHDNPSRERAGMEMLARYGRVPGDPLSKVLETAEPILIEEMTEQDIEEFSADAEHARMMRSFGLRSAIVVPLVSRGETLGGVTLMQAESGRNFDREDLTFAIELARRAGVAAENARLFRAIDSVGGRLRASRDELRAILEGVADGVTAQAPDGSLVYANEAAALASGFETPRAMLAADSEGMLARFELFDEDGRPFDAARLPGRLAMQGRRAREATLRFRDRTTGEERWSIVKATPIDDEHGDLTLVINVIEDITKRKLEEARSRFLAEAGRELSMTLEFDATLRRLGRLCVREFADFCMIDVLDEHGHVSYGTVAHRDPAQTELVREFRDSYPMDTSGERAIARVLRSGDSELFAVVTPELLERTSIDARHLEILLKLGGRSGMIVPMVARGRTVGAITLTSTRPGRHYDDADLQLAEELAQRAAIAVDNARLFSDRAYIARALQESLLPPELPEVPGVEAAARFHAAGDGNEVGGDFYDLFETGPGEWVVLIGDVCGKGADAAAVTGLARYTIRAAAMREPQPSAVLETLNEAMLRQRADERFCTVALGRLDIEPEGPLRLTVCSGGHPLPLVLRADGSVTPVGHGGALIGVLDEPNLSDQETTLHPGDALIMFTDGVTEAHAPDHIYGTAELAGILRRAVGGDAAEIAEAIEGAALEGSRGGPRDDIAVLVLRVRPLDEPDAG